MKPEFAIKTEYRKNEQNFIVIDTSKSTYMNIPWRELGDYGKRKFENLLFFNRVSENPKFIYV